jgi:hypothetical protein
MKRVVASAAQARARGASVTLDDARLFALAVLLLIAEP